VLLTAHDYPGKFLSSFARHFQPLAICGTISAACQLRKPLWREAFAEGLRVDHCYWVAATGFTSAVLVGGSGWAAKKL
jgi:hypothetical protein